MSEHVQIDCTTGMASVSDEPGQDQQLAMISAETGLAQRAMQDRAAEARRAALARLRFRVESYTVNGHVLPAVPLTMQDLADLLIVVGEP